MRYPLVTAVIGIIWLSMMLVISSYPESGENIFIITLVASVAIFHSTFSGR